MTTNTYHLTYTDNQPNDYSINQGVDYTFTIQYPADITLWVPTGTIRRNWADNDTTQHLALFNFQTPIYDSITGLTTILPYLTAEQTSLIPHTLTRANSKVPAVPGSNVWVYDIDIVSLSGQSHRLVGGYVEVRPGVTLYPVNP